ncbi:phage tail spike protein [Clostridium perfringens]|uniref:phage tail spike protein n=1 Tax=Clostridium perfringens TaxID=1502 RepID=UPI0021478328|nr:phage tail spike protein [Clostridium perfringens]UUR88541.1 phage tail protein [Clostridium perfringens]
MLKLKDKNKKLVAGLINYKDLCIESVLATGDKKLSFSLHKEDKFYNFIEEECYIETKEAEFVIKARDVGVNYTKFDCVLNLEELEANIFDRFESVEQTITASLNLAIVGTGWTVKDNTLKKKRTVRCTNKNALEIVQEIKKTYRVDIVFNTLSKQIEVYEHLGEDKGAYFIDSLNLTALQVQSDSYKFATRIIAEGKDGLTFEDINKGKNYVENFQYSKKIKTIYWKDERYTIKESLLEDARAKLEEISKPFVSYNASILNLAELNPKYKNILDYQLGDTITLLSKNNKVKDKQRIVKTLEYPQDHSRDTVELANAVLKFEDIQQENQETTNTVSNITVDNGTIDGSTIDGIKVNQIDNFKANVVEAVNLKAINANIDNLHVNKADIQDLHAVTAKIGTLEATKADITQLNAVNADISNLNAIKANITELNAANGKIDVLESKTASIDNLLAGNLTANNFKANSITANSGIIAEGAIGSGQISSLTANKINAGTIDLSLVTVAGPNGRLRLQGNKLQIMDNKDGKLYERIMLGVDSNNNSSLVLRGADGKTILLNQDGLTKAGITEGFNKIDDNSIDASLIFDKNSMVRNINGATETIKGTRIQVGDRTLDVELSTQKNTITEHGKELSSQKATIQALDNAIKLKVDTQTFTQSNTSINSKIDKVKEESIKVAENLALEKSNLVKKYAEEVAIAKANLAKEEAIASADGKISDEEKKRIKQAQENLNTAIDKADKAKQDAILEANRVAELKKTEAIKTAGLDATNKANNALKDAKDYTNSEIITVNTHLNKSTSEINLLKDEITLKVNKSDVDKTIKTIEDKIKLTTDKITTVESKLTQENNSIKASVQDLNSTTQTITANISNISKDLTSKINSNLDAAKSFATDIAIAKANLAKEQAIANADGKITEEERKRIQQAQENLNAAIARADKAKQDAINVASTDATNKANNALNSAKTYVNAEITTVNNKVHNVESNLNILSNEIKSKVSQSDIDKSIHEIKIGGRNLIVNSDILQNLFSPLSEYSGTREVIKDDYALCKKDVVFKCTHSGTGFHLPLFTKNSNRIGKTYTWSFWAKCSVNKRGTIGHESNGQTQVEFTTEWKKFSHTWLFGDCTYSSFTFYIGWNVGEVLYIRDFKIEEGTKATDWTAAPEDTNQLIVDSIKVIDTKISDVSSSVTQLRDSVTTDIRAINSKTQSIETTLNGKASKQEVTEVNNRVATIKASLDSITQRVSSTESKTQTLESNINGKASKQEVNNVSSKVASVETSLNGITQRVSSTESNISKTNDRINSLASKEEVAQLKITTNSISTEVSKKVNGRDIISTINQSAESVKINASRINLQGYVTVGDLGSSNVTTINNAHVTSGVIEGRTMIALNGSGRENGILTVNNGESYLEYFRCREAWMMSPYANGWRVPLIHSKFGVKDSETASDMIDEISFYRGTDGRNYLQITNTKTGRVEYIELYRSAFDTVTILNRLDRIDAKLAGL